MELLVATLAHTTPGRDADVLAHIGLIADTVRNAPGLVTSRFYRGRGDASYYFMLTAWDDEESWRRAQERHNPKHLLLAATDLLTAFPEQWFMRYLWGYNRPAAIPLLAAAHLATIHPEQIEFVQRGWKLGLRRLVVQPTLATAFLARGSNEDPAAIAPTTPEPPNVGEGASRGTIMLNMLTWTSDSEREEYYADPDYQAIHKFVSSVGVVRILSLEPM